MGSFPPGKALDGTGASGAGFLGMAWGDWGLGGRGALNVEIREADTRAQERG